MSLSIDNKETWEESKKKELKKLLIEAKKKAFAIIEAEYDPERHDESIQRLKQYID